MASSKGSLSGFSALTLMAFGDILGTMGCGAASLAPKYSISGALQVVTTTDVPWRAGSRWWKAVLHRSPAYSSARHVRISPSAATLLAYPVLPTHSPPVSGQPELRLLTDGLILSPHWLKPGPHCSPRPSPGHSLQTALGTTPPLPPAGIQPPPLSSKDKQAFITTHTCSKQ